MSNTDVGSAQPREASAAVRNTNEALLAVLPFADRADYDDAARGFIGTIENAHIVTEKGRTVWSLEPYGFLSQKASPHTINPSLFRQAQLNMNHGLFEVVPGVYQVRGFDIAKKVPSGASVLVVGCGGVGLNIVQGASLVGARTIIAVDLLDNKLEYAKAFGATHTINGKKENVVEKVRAITEGGVDYAFDAIGMESTVLQIVDAVAPGGVATMVGIPSMTAKAPISPFGMVFQEKTLGASFYGSVQPDIDFPIFADLYMGKKINLDSLISRTFKLEEINEGFEQMRTGGVARGVIVFD